MAREQSIYVRVKVRDAAQAKRLLRDLGKEGKSSLERISNATHPINKGLAATSRALTSLKTLAATVAVGAVLTKAVREFAEFDRGLIGVGKTAGLAGKDLDALGARIRQISLGLPVATAELLANAQAAGQLGVKGADNISRFAETVGKLGLASNLAGEEGATALARILTVTGTATSDVDRLASTIVRLGNNFAATEADIAAAATRVAQGTAQFGTSAAEVAGIAAALRAVGVEAEAGGTVVGRAFQAINDAVRGGGESLTALEKITGESADSLRAMFAESSTKTFESFVGGLGRIQTGGGDVAAAMAGMGLEGVRVVGVLGTLATRTGVLTDAMAQARGEWQSNTALTVEALAAAQSFSAQMTLVGNEVDAVAADLGAALAPQLLEIAARFREIIDAARDSGDLERLAGGLGDLFEFIVANSREIATVFAALGAMLVTPIPHPLAKLLAGVAAGGATYYGMSGGPDSFAEMTAELDKIESKMARLEGRRGLGVIPIMDNLRARRAEIEAELALREDMALARIEERDASAAARTEDSAARNQRRIEYATEAKASAATAQARKQALADVQRLEDAAAKAGLSGLALQEAKRDEALAAQRARFDQGLLDENDWYRARLAINDAYQAEVAEAENDAHVTRLEDASRAEIRAAEKREQEAARAAERHAEMMMEPFKNALAGIQDSFTDVFENIFNGGVDSFTDLGASVKRIFVRLAAEIATLMVIKPVVAGVLGGVGLGGIASSLGLGAAGGAPAAAGAAAAGGGGIGTSLFGIGTGFLTGFQSVGLGQALSGAALDIGLGNSTAAFLGNGGINLPYGAFGALGANLLGLGSGNGLVDAGFGTGGALIGGALGGPLGAIAGSFLGTTLGGTFFGKKQGVGANAGANVHIVNGQAVQSGAGADNGGDINQAISFAQAAADSLNAFADVTGGSFSRTGYIGSFGSMRGQLFASPAGEESSYYRGASGDAALIQTLQRAVATGLITGLDAEIQSAVSRADTSSLENFFGDLQFAQSLAGIVIGDKEEITQAQMALDAINKEFAELAGRANRLGLSEQMLAAARDRAIAGLKTGFDDGITRQIDLFLDPFSVALADLTAAQEARLREAQALGADIVAVERLAGLERQRIIAANADGLAPALQSFFNELTFGKLSGATPLASIEGLRASFEASAAQALAGDSGARGRIEDAGRALLDASRGTFASGAGYQSDLARVQSVVGDLVAGNDNAVVSAINGSGSETARLLSELLGEVADLRDVTRVQAVTIADLVSEIQRLVSAA